MKILYGLLVAWLVVFGFAIVEKSQAFLRLLPIFAVAIFIYFIYATLVVKKNTNNETNENNSDSEKK